MYRPAHLESLTTWTVVHDGSGGIHHWRRVLDDGTHLVVDMSRTQSVPSYYWRHYQSDTGKRLAGSRNRTYYGSARAAEEAADQHIAVQRAGS